MLVLGTRGHRFDPCRPDHKLHFMKMYQEINELQKFTVEEFQKDFDALIERVENGESFIITDGERNAVIVPYNEVVHVFEESNVDDEVIRLHTDHEEGS
jgi:antitoxin (DNA-binding transcriptional repressor) of toxin-antitoxin stability system